MAGWHRPAARGREGETALGGLAPAGCTGGEAALDGPRRAPGASRTGKRGRDRIGRATGEAALGGPRLVTGTLRPTALAQEHAVVRELAARDLLELL